VDACTIHANPDKIDDIGNENNDNIIYVGDIDPNQLPAQNLIVMPDLTDDNHNNNEDVQLDNDDLSNDDDNDDYDKDDNANQDHAVHFNDKPSQEDGKAEDQGVRRSRCKNRGVTDKYADYTLLIAVCCKECNSKRYLIIHNGVCFLFLDNSLSNTKPIPEKDRYKYALGVDLVTYLIGVGIKKFQEQREAGVRKELTQMHNMSMFLPVMQELLSKKSKRRHLPCSCS
jgi:hypothetical protein